MLVCVLKAYEWVPEYICDSNLTVDIFLCTITFYEVVKIELTFHFIEKPQRNVRSKNVCLHILSIAMCVYCRIESWFLKSEINPEVNV